MTDGYRIDYAVDYPDDEPTCRYCDAEIVDVAGRWIAVDPADLNADICSRDDLLIFGRYIEDIPRHRT